MNAALLAGALVGCGVTAIIAALRPAAPDLKTALVRLNQTPLPGELPHASLRQLWQQATTIVTERARLSRHGADLALLGLTPHQMAGRMIGYAVLGLSFPAVLGALMSLAGVRLPFLLPTLASLVLAALFFLLPVVDLRRQAAKGRTQMRVTVCAYLELVALERAADAGPVEALDRAADIGEGPGFAHLRAALLRARVERQAPWQQLAGLGDQLAVPELRDVADIMRLSGESGAAVIPSLRARAASLREGILQSDVAAANSASERMAIPVALLGIAFMILLGYPALARILLA